MDKKKPKKITISKSNEKSKSKSKEKSSNKKTTKNPIVKKIKTNLITKKPVVDKKKKQLNNKSKSKSKTKVKKGKKGKSLKKKKGKGKEEETNTIMITQKLDGDMFVKKKKGKEEKKYPKEFAELKIGTPHFDRISYIKNCILKKERLIEQLNERKKNMIEKIRTIYNKLDGMESLLNETPEQKEKLAMLYFILNLNKKNYKNSANIKNKFKEEYNNLLLKNKYDPIEKLTEVGNKINISKSENFEISKIIEKLKHLNISSKYKIKRFTKRENNTYEINNLICELNALNNQKHETLIKITNSKKIINSAKIKFQNLLKFYDEKKMMNQTSLKLEKDIDILKNDLLIKNEYELFNKIYNEKCDVFINRNIHILKLKISRNSPIPSEHIFPEKKPKIMRKNKSIESLKINKNQIKEINDNYSNINKKRIFEKNILPKINSINENNKNELDEKDETTQVNKSMIFEELTDTKTNDLNLQEMNFKIEYYKIVDKKLDNSIKDIENMYKRKIKNLEEELNINNQNLMNLKRTNNLLKIEIENSHKIIQKQIKQFVTFSEKKNISYVEYSNNNINNDDNYEKTNIISNNYYI